jgi:hypothetical protein
MVLIDFAERSLQGRASAYLAEGSPRPRERSRASKTMTLLPSRVHHTTNQGGHAMHAPVNRTSSVALQEPTSPSPEKYRTVTNLIIRDEWVRDVAAIDSLSMTQRVIGMRLGHHFGKTGQVNPSYATLAIECATTERTAKKAVAALRALGWITPAQNAGGNHDATNDFTLLIPPRRVSSETPVKLKPKRLTGVRRGSGRVSSEVFDGCPAGHPNSSKEKERGITERVEDDARSEYEERVDVTVTDAAPSPAKSTIRDAALDPTTQTEMAPDATIELEKDQSVIDGTPAELLPVTGLSRVTGAANLDEAAADAHVTSHNDNSEADAMPIETTDWRIKKNFWEVRRCYMKDRHGDVDRDLEAYAVALADGHSAEEILDAACAMTFSAIDKGGVYPWIPELAKFLTSLPPPDRIAA